MPAIAGAAWVGRVAPRGDTKLGVTPYQFQGACPGSGRLCNVRRASSAFEGLGWSCDPDHVASVTVQFGVIWLDYGLWSKCVGGPCQPRKPYGVPRGTHSTICQYRPLPYHFRVQYIPDRPNRITAAFLGRIRTDCTVGVHTTHTLSVELSRPEYLHAYFGRRTFKVGKRIASPRHPNSSSIPTPYFLVLILCNCRELVRPCKPQRPIAIHRSCPECVPSSSDGLPLQEPEPSAGVWAAYGIQSVPWRVTARSAAASAIPCGIAA